MPGLRAREGDVAISISCGLLHGGQCVYDCPIPQVQEWFAVYHLVGIDGLSDVPDACEEPSRYHQNEEASVMPVVHIRDVSRATLDRLKARARRNDRSLQA